MNASPPEPEVEYSKGPRRSERRPRATAHGRAISPGARRAAILAGGLTGALLLLIAEFTTLFGVTAQGVAVRSVGSGAHHGYALVPVSLLVAALSWTVWRGGSRPALLAIGALGLIALLIAVLGDLPDAHATGLVFRGGHYISAGSSPSTGMYMETLGAVLLLITCGCAFFLAGGPAGANGPALPAPSSPDA